MPRAFPDLTNARRAVERLMADTGEISRDTDGDEVLNETTGLVSNPAPVLIYSGKCKLKLESQTARTEGGHSVVVQSFACGIPIGSPEILPGDWFTVTSSARDTLLVTKKLRITAVEGGTMTIQRRFTAEATVQQVSEARP